MNTELSSFTLMHCLLAVTSLYGVYSPSSSLYMPYEESLIQRCVQTDNFQGLPVRHVGRFCQL